MPDRFAVEITPRAAAEIREASAWWRSNRPLAPRALAEDLERAFLLVSVEPGIGAHATNVGQEQVRRLLLGRAGYHLYHQVDPAGRRVEILALWHARRGSNPPL